jgi:uncharacterized protein (UPF0333 family)
MLGKMRGSTGQVAMEYMVILAMVVLMTIPLVLIFTVQTQNMQTDITNAQIDKVGDEILAAVSDMYYMGSPAQKTIRIAFPAGLDSISISGKLIEVTVTTAESSYDLYWEMPTNVTGSLGVFEGDHIIVIQARSNDVYIHEK